jgi:antitoxin ParD1/3/4
MTITLHPHQEAWLRTRVASGEFASVEEAARQLIDDRIAELADDNERDEMAWAKPYIDEGLAALDRGEFVSLEDHKAQIAALLESLKT